MPRKRSSFVFFDPYVLFRRAHGPEERIERVKCVSGKSMRSLGKLALGIHLATVAAAVAHWAGDESFR